MVWDACALLNLLSTGMGPEVLRSLADEHAAERHVVEGEVRYLRPMSDEQGDDQQEPVDCSELTDSGILRIADLAPNERVLFVRLAEHMDDGEARSGALAIGRGLALVTDDRQALRWFRSERPAVPVVTTPDWVQLWASTTGADPGMLVCPITLRARYRPRFSDPAYAWWMAALDE